MKVATCDVCGTPTRRRSMVITHENRESQSSSPLFVLRNGEHEEVDLCSRHWEDVRLAFNGGAYRG